MRIKTLKYWPSIEQSLLGGMALASLAAACIWLVLGPAPDVADHLSASGNVGPGATFRFSLPLHPEGNTP